MIPMVGYDASYQRRAFKSQVDPDGLPRMALESSIRQAARIVYSKSEGRWLITIKAGFVPFDVNEPVELMVIVPAGSDQYDQYLAAVKEFEDCMTGYPVMDPMDTSLRTLEEYGAKCMHCDKKPKWFYSTSMTGKFFFCDQHAQEDPDFRGRYYAWMPFAQAIQ